VDIIPSVPLAFRPVVDTTVHICMRCAKGVHNELRKVMPAEESK